MVEAFASEQGCNCGFIPAPSLELPSLQYDKAFTDEIGHSGTWNGEALEDFAVRTVTTRTILPTHTRNRCVTYFASAPPISPCGI
ncbi:hypothetical protein EDB85DRAFT_2297281 [Lactarius pseudohatsudake]|nr:hypothetical protein EDB85DRAFT_2297281 [Lactarius pseudohatsudake]